MLDALAFAAELGISRSSQWNWVALGYFAMYGTLVAYVGWIAYRTRRARQRLLELQ